MTTRDNAVDSGCEFDRKDYPMDSVKDVSNVDQSGSIFTEIRERLQRIVAGMRPGAMAFDYFVYCFHDLQHLWYQVKQLPGEPRSILASIFAAELQHEGISVHIVSPADDQAPKVPWKRVVEVIVSVQQGKRMPGYIGLGGRVNGWTVQPPWM